MFQLSYSSASRNIGYKMIKMYCVPKLNILNKVMQNVSLYYIQTFILLITVLYSSKVQLFEEILEETKSNKSFKS